MRSKRGLELGRPLPSSLLADRSWFPAGALFIAHLAFSAYGDRGLVSAILLAAVTVFAYFVSVVLHTCAHLLTARAAGVRVNEFRLFVFGDVHTPDRTRRRDAVVALAGPVASGLIGGGLYLWASPRNGALADITYTTALANLALAAVNLAPGLPLDGGRVLAAFAQRRFARRTGQLCAVLAVAAGAWLLVQGDAVIADIAEAAPGIWLLVVGIFVFVEARRTPLDDIAHIDTDEEVGRWARPFAGRVRIDDPPPTEGGPYAVSDGGRLAGVLTAGVPHSRRRKRVCDVMIPWRSELGVRADVPVGTALERLASGQSEVVVVIDAKGTVRGVVDEEAVRARVGK